LAQKRNALPLQDLRGLAVKSYHSSGDKNRAIIAQTAIDSDGGAVPEYLPASIANTYSNINLLFEAGQRARMNNAEPTSLFSRAIGLNELEMLEAELSNQGLIPKYRKNGCLRRPSSDIEPSARAELILSSRADSCATLAQKASLDAIAWRWRARRSGYKSHEIGFVVDVPNFLLYWAIELSAKLEKSVSVSRRSNDETLFLRTPHVQSNQPENRASIVRKLRYIDAFAAFLLGNSSTQAGPFQRGLDVVLRALTANRSSSSQIEASIEPRYSKEQKEPSTCNRATCVLPTTRRSFFHLLHSVKDS
jgi:hypothetical protein